MEKLKPIRWNPLKNELLKKTRNLSFERIEAALNNGQFVSDLKHPKHEDQRILIVNLEGYAYVIPYRETEIEIHWITIFPSRKYTKQFLKGSHEEKK